MSSLFPVLTESGRRWWVLAAVIMGALGAIAAFMRRDWPALALVVIVVLLLVAVWRWTSGGGEGEE